MSQTEIDAARKVQRSVEREEFDLYTARQSQQDLRITELEKQVKEMRDAHAGHKHTLHSHRNGVDSPPPDIGLRPGERPHA